jgi:hypothetical protein
VLRLIKTWQLAILALLSCSSLAVLFSTKYTQLPPEVPLFYFRQYGYTQLVTKDWLLLLPVVIIAMTLGNYLAARILKEDAFVKTILYWATLYNTIMLTVLFVRVIFKVS